jgi:hypothetical protein
VEKAAAAAAATATQKGSVVPCIQITFIHECKVRWKGKRRVVGEDGHLKLKRGDLDVERAA